MPEVSKDVIIRETESPSDRAHPNFRLSPTFGAGAAIIELNPSPGEKG